MSAPPVPAFPGPSIALNPNTVTRLLGGTASLLVTASIGMQLFAYRTGDTHAHALARLFYVDAERNIPSDFSTLLLLIAAVLLAVVAVMKRQQSGSRELHWVILSAGFLLMAADEAWSFHEKLIEPIRNLIGAREFGIFYFAWVIPGIAIVMVVALTYLKFLLRLPSPTRIAFLVAAILYLGGAIGVELIGGRYVEVHGSDNLTYSMVVALEESLEMAGTIMFIGALLGYIANHYGEVRFRLSGGDGTPAR